VQGRRRLRIRAGRVASTSRRKGGAPTWAEAVHPRWVGQHGPVDRLVRVGEVSIHRLDRWDEAALEEVFAGLSPNSRFARYHTGTPSLPSGSRKLLRRIDGSDVAALVARDAAGAAIGLVWLIRTGESAAELAIEVVDAWHRCGAGSRLLREADVVAAQMGICNLTADVLATNRAAARLLLKAAPHATVAKEGPEFVFEWQPATRGGARQVA
jgi:L-amino acid N-acyltransferase YncA